MFADTVLTRAPGRTARRAVDWEFAAEATLLSAVLVLGLVTAASYGTTVDEFNVEPYGHQALAWYFSGFTDRALFNNAEVIHLYGPWFHMLTAAVQRWASFDPLTIRHAMTFVVGLLGIAALGPLARLVIGRWAGLVAIVLCLTTGYLYGHLFFSPIDVPFLAAMTWATLAIVVATRRTVPSWRATIIAGLAMGLALGTRPGGLMAQVYFVGAIALCAFEAFAREPANIRQLRRIALRALAALTVAWAFAIAIWPWLQIGNPFVQFWDAFTFFTKMDIPFTFLHWGEEISTAALPWHYIPAQLLARLPEPFLALIALSIVFGIVAALRFTTRTSRHLAARRAAGLRAPLYVLARHRDALLIAVAAFSPILMIIVLDSTIYDGVRHILFVLPMLAVAASWSFVRLLPLMRRFAFASAAAIALYLFASVASLASLHPLQYAAVNLIAGGVDEERRFELDYWSAAATTAVRQLEQRLDRLAPGQQPRVMVCIGWREQTAASLFRRDWIIVTNQNEADFLIETERFPCAEGTGAMLIDEVRRSGHSFARTYIMRNPQKWLRQDARR